ncbi:MAG: methyltransferase domain-containing protein [Aggregatilineales bacterium]
MPWNPTVYEKFKAQRAAPFEDLLVMIEPRAGLNVIDLGCGTGELTRRLADALPGSTVLGVDNSPEMLARTAEFVRPGLHFEIGNLEAVDGQYDLVFSHAAIHWLDNHETLIPHLLSMVQPGGQLAVQLPSNHGHRTHVLIREIAAEAPFKTALGGWSRQSSVLAADQYAELLYTNGGRNLNVFEKVYPHVLENADALADWTSGTALVPYFERLPEAMHDPFMQRYRDRLRASWPDSPVFYGFRRILFAATVEG